MAENKKEYVQCFINIEYNYMHERGQLKFSSGFHLIKLLGERLDLRSQIVEAFKLNEDDVFNLNIKAMTPFPDEVFRVK